MTAIVGTVIGYQLVKLIFNDISFATYLLIEFIITFFHYLYNEVKKDLIKNKV